MAYKLQLKRGASGSLPTGSAGEPLFTTDTNDLYIGTGAANQKFQKYIASGTSAQFLKGDGSLDSNTYYLASNPSAFIALTALTASAPLSYNNTTGAFTISQASGSVNGFLSSTDWTTFNNKQNTITLTTTGTSGAATLVGATLNIPQYQSVLTNPVTGTGTTNYLAKFTGANIIGNSLIYDDGTTITFQTGASERARITSTGNLLVNSVVDNGNRLQVTGNGYFSGNVGVGTTSLQATYRVTISGTDSIFPSIYLENTTNSQAYSIRATTTNFIIRDNTSGNDRVTLTNSGNLGLGVVPSAWGSGYVGLQVNSGLSIMGSSVNGNFVSNCYYDGTNWKYTQNAFATNFYSNYANNGSFVWSLAPSGTAGNAITFTQAMTLTAAGRLLLGTTTEGTHFLDVSGNGRFVSSSSTNLIVERTGSNGVFIGLKDSSGSFAYIGANNGDFIVQTPTGSYSTKLTIANSGAATFSSSVTAAIFDSTSSVFRFSGNNALSLVSLGGQSVVKINAAGYWGTQLVGANDQGILINNTGNVGIGTTSPSEKFVVSNGGSQNIEINPSFIQSFNRSSPGYAELPFYASKFSFNVGNLLVGTTTDSGERLVVSGGSYFSGNVGIGVPAANKLSIKNGASQLDVNTTTSTVTLEAIDRANTSNSINFEYYARYGSHVFYSGAYTERMRIKSDGKINFPTLPTSSAGLSAGDIWNDGGTLKIV